MSKNIVLEVPFIEKDKAKSLGAWWDPQIKKWYVPSGTDSGPFKRWIPEDGEKWLESKS